MVAQHRPLADLSDADRQELEAWLVAFAERWEDGILAQRVEQIPPGSSWRLPALAEMVKIDLQRQWQHGRQVSLESYLAHFPELGGPADVSAELIQAEYEVRRQFGAPAALEGYIQRFPHQAVALAGLLAQGSSSRARGSASGAFMLAATPSDIPEQFGRYRIIRRLGQGGMGSVYLAEDTQLRRRVALKVASFGTQGSLEARQRLLAEARAAATLDHPYLCPVHDVGEIDGRLYLTMAYIEGQSLAESTGGNSLPERQVAALVGKLALALQEAHAKGVIHRDLKPSNVMIKKTVARREPVIVDFGLARRDDGNEAHLTRTGQVMGTLDYMAPEQLRGDPKQIGPACDIYALGVILYELLTGQRPFEGSGLAVMGQILTQPPYPPSTIHPGLDLRLEAICLKAMAKNAGDRFASMGALAAALTEYLRAQSASVPSPTAAPAPSGAAAAPAGSDTLMARLLDRVGTNPAPSPAMADALPAGLANHPDYEIKRELGRGGMGVVYLAHNKLMGRDEVLKVVGRQVVDRAEVLERFLREIRAVARLRHPNIVTAYSAMRLGESIVFAMEYVEGRDLAHLVQAKGPLPVAHACNFAYQAALGLQHAYEEGLVHRDIKPGNLMLARQGEKAIVKILDFGLAKATREEKVEGALTWSGQALGTPDYIAPEQIVDAPSADIRADIYSLGATLYYLLTGRPPFHAKSLYDVYQAHISRHAEPLDGLRGDVPAELAALVAKMMTKEPAQRFQTPAEVARALVPFFKNASAALKRPRADVAEADPVAPDGGYAVAPLETEADRLRGRRINTVGPASHESRWESLIELRETESSAEQQEATPRGRSEWRRPAVVAGVLLMLGFVALLLGGVFKVKTPDGLIVLENVPRDAEVLVDGAKVNVTWPGLGKPLEIRAVPGQHKVEVKKEGFKTFGEVVTVKADDSDEITVRLEPLVADRPDPKRAEPIRPQPARVEPTPVPIESSQTITNSIAMKLILIPAGDFLMGSPDSDGDAEANEKPQHRVRIARPFYLGATEVTQGQYRAVTGATPSSFKGSDDLPVEQVSWNDAIAFCTKLSKREGLKPSYQSGVGAWSAAEGYRLPTEAEWEYACRAGSTTKYSLGDYPGSLGEYAWCSDNSGQRTHPVGWKRPNAWGLYDMHGNVWEWCWDAYSEDYYRESPDLDPHGPPPGTLGRVFRGGGWDFGPQGARSADRSAFVPGRRGHSLGFRVARVWSSDSVPSDRGPSALAPTPAPAEATKPIPPQPAAVEPTPVPVEAPHLRNGGFEDGLLGWEIHVYGAYPRPEPDAHVRHGGKQSLQIMANELTDTALGQEVTLTPGQWYRFRGWVKTQALVPQDATAYGTFQIQRPGGQSGAIAIGANHRGDTDWTEITLHFEAPPDGRVRVAVFLMGFGKGTGTAWFDDLSLVPVNGSGRP
jgi:serine/threonine protein kinase/formylglycine-generating enzyme required for sulfatase activity